MNHVPSPRLARVLEYLAAVAKGKALFKQLKSVQADKSAARSLEQSYKLEEDELLRDKPKDLKKALTKFGIGFDYVEYVSVVP